MKPASSGWTPVEMRERLGAAIKAIRKEKKLNQDQITDSGNLSRLESGQQWVSDEQLLTIATKLKTPIWLIFAHAEGVFDERLWAIIHAYNNADSDGQEHIERAASLVSKQGNNNNVPRHPARLHRKGVGR